MKALEKIARIERLYEKLKNQNRSMEFYKDDLLFCFYECWSVRDWLLNDTSVRTKNPNIEPLIKEHVSQNDFIKMSFDIANREKHLELRNNQVDGKISNTKIGIHAENNIHVGISDISIKLIHVDDIKEYDAKIKEQEELKNQEETQQYPKESKALQTGTSYITQEYVVTNNKGDTYDALLVIHNTVESWKDFIHSLN